MSRILGPAIHQCFVYPDFDSALARFAAGGIGPFYVMRSEGGEGRHRGVVKPLDISVAFVFSGDTCMEIIAPHGPQENAYVDFLEQNPGGGLHHVAYYSTDFEASLAAMEAAGHPLRIVQEFYDTNTGEVFEIYCEPVGVDNPVCFQLLRPGVFDAWFDAMHAAAANWDGKEPIRNAMALMQATMAPAEAG